MFICLIVDGCSFDRYVSSLPESVLPHLDEQLDWDHGNVDIDLNHIADVMTDWEKKLSAPLGFTRVEIGDLKRSHRDVDPPLLRYARLG